MSSSMKDQTGSVSDRVAEMSPSDEEALIEAMAADYGEALSEPVKVTEPEPVKKNKKKKVEETGRKQASLFDF